MLQDGLHGVARLLPRYAQVFLEWAAQRGEHRLGSLVRAQGLLPPAYRHKKKANRYSTLHVIKRDREKEKGILSSEISNTYFAFTAQAVAEVITI